MTHRRWLSATLLAITLASAGCLSHMPRIPGLQAAAYQEITWRDDLASAQDEARAAGLPLLVFAVAGSREGPC